MNLDENFEEFEEQILFTARSELERLALLNRLADLYNKMLEQTVGSGCVSTTKKPKRVKKMVAEVACAGPYWRTPDFIKQNPGILLSTDCKSLEKPRYKGPVITSFGVEEEEKRICNTCYARWKHDKKLKK